MASSLPVVVDPSQALAKASTTASTCIPASTSPSASSGRSAPSHRNRQFLFSNSTDEFKNPFSYASSLTTPTPLRLPSISSIERGRLKRRRMSSHSPPRDPSPSRGHNRPSGSRHNHHHRKHHRADSSPSVSPPSLGSASCFDIDGKETSKTTVKNRRRSDAEPDHTLRGRARVRSRSRSRSWSEEDDEVVGERERRRDMPPSRGRDSDEGRDEVVVMRRQRSLKNLYELERGRVDSFAAQEVRMNKAKGKGTDGVLRV